MKLQVGDEIVVKTSKRFFRAKITEIWPSKYDSVVETSHVLEIEYENLFCRSVREIIDSCYVYGVKPRVQKG